MRRRKARLGCRHRWDDIHVKCRTSKACAINDCLLGTWPRGRPVHGQRAAAGGEGGVGRGELSTYCCNLRSDVFLLRFCIHRDERGAAYQNRPAHGTHQNRPIVGPPCAAGRRRGQIVGRGYRQGGCVHVGGWGWDNAAVRETFFAKRVCSQRERQRAAVAQHWLVLIIRARARRSWRGALTCVGAGSAHPALSSPSAIVRLRLLARQLREVGGDARDDDDVVSLRALERAERAKRQHADADERDDGQHHAHAARLGAGPDRAADDVA
ncbi:hypothetical protein T492DRAFT_105658 [Pavlovales sp. CCMP2436]|nr:hypothetical protein T492DRAFT_105658 [Pavlovales sp. CCMP2436]